MKASKTTLNLGAGDTALLAHLCEAHGWSKSYTLRRGLQLLAEVERRKARGEELMVSTPDGVRVLDIIGLS